MQLLAYFYFFFFFQAEDGIRDVERSRGLGDVYKRQDLKEPDQVCKETKFVLKDILAGTQICIDTSKEEYLADYELFRCIDEKVQEMMKKYGRTWEEVMKALYLVSGDTLCAEKLFQLEETTTWNELEDLTLRESSPRLIECLEKQKGPVEVNRRRDFLNSL
eukprot:TRINITY_DN2009_c0_g1_i4.p3 TRINITY_DN2009_c0_g1~~TRINITY_DN2009_c0_g1_i4.p3  ORF type:complete len:162 (+),score=36.70 TRINITY_DN2009_c0_g1_i4:103-588(+)